MVIRPVFVPLALCAAVAATQCSRPTPGISRPTFTATIAPILYEHCVTCHSPGRSAPFSLLTYADVQPRASLVAGAVQSRLMPPWLPDHLDPAFVGERRLTDDHIALIQQWARTGAPEGDPASLPAPPAISSTWQLGPPDLIASPARPYTLVPGGHDVYRNLVIRLAAPGTRYVRAMEFMPGAAPVHHAVIRIDTQRLSRADDGADGEPGFDGMAATGVQDPDGHFLGWAPGRGPIVAPDNLPWVLTEGSDLVIELHLMPGATPVAVQPAIGLFFTDRAPAKSPVMLVMGSKAIDIPAGAPDYTIEDRYTLPVDVEVLSVYPHAHYLGREMDARAVAPDGTARPLIHIRQWSFSWQQDYRFVTPIALSQGTTIVMTYSYDNSAGNKKNPNQPPRRVTWGPQSHDEMGNLGVQVVTRSPADSARLAESFARHAAAIDVAGGETLVKADPQSASHAALLGISYVRAGRFADAIPQLERALRLDPRQPLRRKTTWQERSWRSATVVPRSPISAARPRSIPRMRTCITTWQRCSLTPASPGRRWPSSRGRWRSIPSSRKLISRSARCCSRPTGSARPCPTFNARLSFGRGRPMRMATSAARWPRPAAATKRWCISSARWRSTPATRPPGKTWPASDRRSHAKHGQLQTFVGSYRTGTVTSLGVAARGVTVMPATRRNPPQRSGRRYRCLLCDSDRDSGASGSRMRS